jgi:tetratricopeptide (TPR) repeat protein
MSVTLLSPDPVDGLGADDTLMDALDAAVNNVGNRFSSEPEVDAEIRSSIGWAYFKLTRYDDAEPLIREALRIREGMSGGESLGLSTSLCQVGALLEVRNQPDSAEAMYHRALDMSRRLLPGNHRQIAET